MQPAPLNIVLNDDPTLVNLNQETLATISKLEMGLRFLREQDKNNKLTAGFKETMASNIHTYALEILKGMNYDSQLEVEEKARFERIRELNNENRELRKQLGEKVSNEDFRECIGLLTAKIQDWWKELGFSHVSDCDFGENRLKIKFGCITFDGNNFFAPAGEDDEATGRNRLKQLGFVFTSDDSNAKLRDNDNNRSLLQKLIVNRFPSARVTQTKNHFHRDRDSEKEGFVLYDVEVILFNFDEI